MEEYTDVTCNNAFPYYDNNDVNDLLVTCHCVNTWRSPAVSEETARKALVHYASSKCCYGTKATQKLVINSITPSTMMHVSWLTVKQYSCASHFSVPTGDLHWRKKNCLGVWTLQWLAHTTHCIYLVKMLWHLLCTISRSLLPCNWYVRSDVPVSVNMLWCSICCMLAQKDIASCHIMI